jgi:hypothetical protein
MSDRVAAMTKAGLPSIEASTFAWSWRGTPIPVGYEVSGPAGAEPILMLPAMSTVSTRSKAGSWRAARSAWPRNLRATWRR